MSALLLALLPVLASSDACDSCSCYERRGKFFVDCSYMGLSNIPTDIPAKTSRLYLNGNNITEVGYDNRIYYNDNLRELYLHNNPIANIHEDAFQNTTQIHTLLLHYTSLGNITTPIFKNLRRLKWLWLNNAKLKEIDDYAFADLTELYELQFFGNNITELGDSMFSNLTKLEHLYAWNNPGLSKPTCCTLCGLDPSLVTIKWQGIAMGDKLSCGCDVQAACSTNPTCFVETCNNFVYSYSPKQSSVSYALLLMSILATFAMSYWP